MRLDGVNFDALAADLDAAVAELIAAIGPDARAWDRGRPGKWAAGRHVAHVGITLDRTAEDFEEAARLLAAGSLPPPPAGRGPLQALFVGLVVRRGMMPRGARTRPWAIPLPDPDRTMTLAALHRDVGRHKALGADLDAAARDRLWIQNPFRPRWHYRLPEILRLHAVHARHHARQVAEIAARP